MSGVELNDGGPAWPTVPKNHGYEDAIGTGSGPGMSLRAYFAGQALANSAICNSSLYSHERVRSAIEHADMMIEILFPKEVA